MLTVVTSSTSTGISLAAKNDARDLAEAIWVIVLGLLLSDSSARCQPGISALRHVGSSLPVALIPAQLTWEGTMKRAERAGNPRSEM
jgi:hypothetical protein